MRLNASDKAGSYKYDLKKLHSNRSALVSIIYCELICTTLILVYALLTSTIPGANPGSKCPFWREENQWQQLVCHRRFLLALSRFIVEFHPSESTSHASNHNFLSVTQKWIRLCEIQLLVYLSQWSLWRGVTRIFMTMVVAWAFESSPPFPLLSCCLFLLQHLHYHCSVSSFVASCAEK